ncbi:membrane or secreted protein [Chitinophaga sp. Cy-1792]|uniref:membrane or secreted protein n=1 Tax=Chitinophaga sp. Cy-1792 TaxID=2608339 RepID=UPI00142352BE|nr:membrane or secreted protein [Chitinophaga sp. Cy-1792]NIG55641.1 membrane or secreted protein [Chitinophaga sp. Cy-1792]
MKTLFNLCLTALLSIAGIFTASAQSPVIGAWTAANGSDTAVLLVTESYFTITTYNAQGVKSTLGGTWEGTSDASAALHIEFNTTDSTLVGKRVDADVSFNGDHFGTTIGGNKTNWSRVDYGNGTLAGLWQITGREVNGTMNAMQAGARKTIKILSGSQFQWVAINTATGEFFGTGGGSYTFENGVYTEKLAYFSRDNSRVGSTLQFKGSVNANKWDHSGKSSQGAPIHEEWTRQ